MGIKYSSQTVSGYNSNPPPDDGTTVAANQVTWAKIKTKLTDAINTWATSINSALVTALDTSASTTSVSYTTTAADHQKPIQVTAAVTISLGDAATMAVGYQTTVINLHSAAITVALATATDTLNSVTNGTISILPGVSVTFGVNQAGNGYTILSESAYDSSGPTHTFPKVTMQGAINYAAEVSIASAATVNIGAAASNNVYITGTTTITAFDTVAAGITRKVRFAGALTLTHNGTSLILPGSANITTAANDCAEFESLGSGNWVCTKYSPASGQQVISPTAGQGSSLVYLGSKTASASASITVGTTAANVSDIKFDWSLYDEIELHFIDFACATNAVDLLFEISTDGGSTFLAGTGYNNTAFLFTGSTTLVTTTGATSSGRITPATQSNTATYTFQGVLTLRGPNNANTVKLFSTREIAFINSAGPSISGGQVVSDYTAVAAYNGIKVYYSSGNIASGTLRVYGIKKS